MSVGAQVDVAELTEIAGTTATLEASARAVTALAQHRLTAMIERSGARAVRGAS